MRILKFVAVFATVASLVAAPGPTLAQDFSRPGLVIRPADRAFIDHISRIIDLMNEASLAVDAFSSVLDGAEATMSKRARRAFWAKRLPAIQDAKAKLETTRAKIMALPRFSSSSDLYVEMAATMKKDAAAYAENMSKMLSSVEALAVAVDADDEDAIEQARLGVKRAVLLALDGQRLMTISRQKFYAAEDVSHHEMGLMTELYTGIGALLAYRFGDIDEAETAKRLRAAARRGRAYVSKGRPLVGRSLETGAANRRIAALDGYILDASETMVTHLEEAAAQLESEDISDEDYDAMFARFVEDEERILKLINDQIEITTRQGV